MTIDSLTFVSQIVEVCTSSVAEVCLGPLLVKMMALPQPRDVQLQRSFYSARTESFVVIRAAEHSGTDFASMVSSLNHLWSSLLDSPRSQSRNVTDDGGEIQPERQFTLNRLYFKVSW